MKKILSIILGLLLCMTLALAQSNPTPVLGKLTINGIAPDGMHVEVRNVDNPDADVITHQTQGSLVTERGAFMFDLGGFGRYEDGEPKYVMGTRRSAGDMIEVKVVGCTPCTKMFNVPRDFPYNLQIVVNDPSVVVPVKEVVVEKPVYTCSEGTKVEEKNQCPVESKEHEEKQVSLIKEHGVALGLGTATILGFAGLYVYYRRKGQTARAEKMAETFKKKK